ncbi:MAG: HPr(Ser) kinase/phosphatase [Elusimicrobiota bacterium]
MINLTVGDLLKEQRDRLRLSLVTGAKSLDRLITTPEVNRPGLTLAGYPAHFRAERIQIIGWGEHAYCRKAPPSSLERNLKNMISKPETPCLVITRNLSAPKSLIDACKKFNVPLLRTRLDTADFIGELNALLGDLLAPMVRMHGVLVDVYGLGVLIVGEAGIGKSECALELIKRGHILVSDDMVEIHQRHGDILIGDCPENLEHHMEVRGLGIIDVKLLFGVGATINSTRIGFIVQLEAWNPSAEYERVGLDQKTMRILDVEVPMIRIPVRPGRNLAVLIEVAALHQRLRLQGYSTAEVFNRAILAKTAHREKRGR